MGLENLNSLNFEESDEKFEEILKKISDIGIKYDLCKLRAKEYKFLSQIDGIREEARKRKNYFLQIAKSLE